MRTHGAIGAVVGDPDEWVTAVGNRVRDERRRRGLSQEELAKQTKLATRTVASIEKGEPTVRPTNRRVVLEFLGIDPSRIVASDGDDIPVQARMGADYARRWIAAKATDADRDDALDTLIRAIGIHDAEH